MRSPYGLGFEPLGAGAWNLYIADSGNHAIRVVASGATPSIARAALAAEWTVGGITPETPSLEQVFRDLMARHVSAAKDKGASA